jgi:STE24 endopeptidase
MPEYRTILLISYLLVQGFICWLELVNLRYIKKYGLQIPAVFEGYINQETLPRAIAYATDKSFLGLAESVFSSVVMIFFLFWGILNMYSSWVMSLGFSFIPGGTVFFLILGLANTALSVPFSLYGTFRIENRFGFNTMTPGLWVSDMIKSLLLSATLLGTTVAAGLWIIQASPDYWWLFLWSFIFLFSLFLMFISPYVVEPLFNKFRPLEGGALEEKVRGIAEKAGIRVSKVFMVDASKRSHHTNAYFTGIGKVKRIVLFDTLIRKMNEDEIIAILAHEIGHWKKRHIVKRLIGFEAASLIGCYTAFRILQTDFLTDMFCIGNGNFFAKVVILSFMAGIVLFPFTALSNYISRRQEEEADRFATDLTSDPESLATSMIKLSRDNLSNLHPHPLYAKFYYSHPPVLERIQKIRSYKS